MIYFVRHGQTDWNLQNKIQGLADIPLNSTGIEQAHQVATQLDGISFDKVFCSPLKRAVQTCQAICAKELITIDERIIERDFGLFEGLTPQQFDFEGFWNINKTFDTGESLPKFIKRIFAFLEELTQKYKGKNILVVCHGGVGMVVKSYFNGAPNDGNYLQYLPSNGKAILYP